MHFHQKESLYSPVGSDGGGIGSDNGGIDSGGGGVDSSGGGVASAMAVGGPIPDPNMRRADLDALHPFMRAAIARLMVGCKSEQLPFRVFEAFRSPSRQAWLYEQGRGKPGARVTNAQPWQSYHQYGLAADFVLWINNQWSWISDGAHKFYWDRLHALGKSCGLEKLDFELPHLQVANLKLADLQKGIFPEGGDQKWLDNLEAASLSWTGAPAAPAMTSLRPALPHRKTASG